MSEVMVDSWGLIDSLSNALKHRQNSKYYNDEYIVHQEHDVKGSPICRHSLLTALILWDDIYINSDSHSISGSHLAVRYLFEVVGPSLKKDNFIHPIPISVQQDIPTYSDLFKKLYNTIKHENCIIDSEEMYMLLWGGIYLMQANSMGVTYLPHPRRAKILRDAEVFPRNFDGRTYLDIVDKEILDYIEAVNKLAQYQLLSVPFPVLNKFIVEMATDPLDEFAVAINLRENKNVALFRKSVNDIEKELKNGNIHALKASLMKVKEACDEVSNSLYKESLSFGVSIGLSPSIEIGRELKPKVSSGFHTTFLSDLMKFALKGTRPTGYIKQKTE
ncbi:MAG: hypothetical protein HDT16_09990 [Oscillibacter sp.]|nr:hypothetical protein [Oscillibacter sp.]